MHYWRTKCSKGLPFTKITSRDICETHQLRHRLCFAWNDARHRSTTALVHRRHEFAKPAAAFLTYFRSQSGQICAVRWQKVWQNECRFLVSEGWLSHKHIGVDLWRTPCTSLLHFVVRVRCRRKESSRSLSHLLMSFLLVIFTDNQ